VRRNYAFRVLSPRDGCPMASRDFEAKSVTGTTTMQDNCHGLSCLVRQ
jgi:hypothetical protein